MPWNGSGTYSLPPAYSPEVNGTVIDATRYNGLTSDVATGITNALAKDGQSAATANIPMGGFLFTGLAAGAAAGNSLRYEQVDLVGTVSVASAATTSIFTSGEQCRSITGTTTITSFGTNTAGQIRYCRSVGALQITYNATSMITPGAANLAIAAGDWFVVKGLGSSNAEIISLTRAASLSTRISDLGAAAAANTIANTTYTQTWGWVFNGSGQKGLHLTGSGGVGQGQLFTVTGSTTTEHLLKVASLYGNMFTVNDGSFTLGASVLTIAGAAASSYVYAGSAASSGGVGADGGALYLSGGTGSTAATGGNTFISAGTGGLANGIVQLYNFTSTAIITLNASGTTLSGSLPLVLDNKHLFVDNTNGSPTITAGGGTGGTILGSDVGFEVVFGTGSPTSVTVTFANAWATAPMVQVSGTQSGQVLHYSSGTGTVQILSSTAFSSGTRISVFCMGKQ